MAVAGPTVVVVEDDESMLQAIERLLDLSDFRTAVFVSAEALLAASADESAACVVSDLKLPGMSGLELMAHLRTRACPPPLILITAHDAPGLCEEATRRGAAAYLVKPFRGTALLDTIRAAIGTETPH